jgi:hypothetical protein
MDPTTAINVNSGEPNETRRFVQGSLSFGWSFSYSGGTDNSNSAS